MELSLGSTTVITVMYKTSVPTSERTQSVSTLKTNRLLRFRENVYIREIYVSQGGVDKVASSLGYDVVSGVSDKFFASIFGVSASHALIRQFRT